MRNKLLSLCLMALAVFAASCNSRTDKSEGSVILTISAFDGLPVGASVNDLATRGNILQVEEITLENFPKDPLGQVSSLMDIELRSYEIVYTRADTGTRRPPTKVQGFFGNVPVRGEDDIVNLVLFSAEQLDQPPLSDLLFENGGFDKETNARTIQINCHLRFFGRTLAGDTIASNTASFVIQFTP